jgi:hypothetical protein
LTPGKPSERRESEFSFGGQSATIAGPNRTSV